MATAARRVLPTADLRGRFDAALPVWLLIDPMLGEPCGIEVDAGDSAAAASTARERVWQRAVTVIELPSVIALPMRMHPYLVALQGAADPWIEESLDIAEQEHAAARAGGLAGHGRAAHRVGGWLQSASSSQALATSLCAAASLRTAARTSARYLRIADRRTLDWLVCIAGAQRMARAVPTVTTWTWLDACASVASIGGADSAVDEALYLSAEHWLRFELAHLVHPTFARWQGEKRKLGYDVEGTASEALQLCERAVQQARTAARAMPGMFTQDDDLIAWAALALLHPGFDTDTRWLAYVADASHRIVPFDLLCHDVTNLLASSQRTTS
jgi:hypothetical protein